MNIVFHLGQLVGFHIFLEAINVGGHVGMLVKHALELSHIQLFDLIYILTHFFDRLLLILLVLNLLKLSH